MKKLGIAFLGMALFVMAALPNQAKAFSVSGNDLYLAVSGGPANEYYYDLGSISSILSSGVTIDFTNSVSGTGWSVIGDTTYGSISGSGTVYFASQASSATLLNTSGLVSNSSISSGFGIFAGGNSGNGSNPDLVSPGSNFATNLGNTLNGGVPTQIGTNKTGGVQALLNGVTNAMNLYAGNNLADLSQDAVVSFTNMIATVKSLGSNNYQLTISLASVPLPPSLVMFVSGLIALGLIARRKQVGI
jgi:hypothetical protein